MLSNLEIEERRQAEKDIEGDKEKEKAEALYVALLLQQLNYNLNEVGYSIQTI